MCLRGLRASRAIVWGTPGSLVGLAVLALLATLATSCGFVVVTPPAAPADASGSAPGQVVVALDRQPVETVIQLRLLLLTRYAVGDPVEVAVNRDARDLVFVVRLAGLTAVGS